MEFLFAHQRNALCVCISHDKTVTMVQEGWIIQIIQDESEDVGHSG